MANFHPQRDFFFSGVAGTTTASIVSTVSFSARAAVAATTTDVWADAFSFRLILDAVVEGTEEFETEVMMDAVAWLRDLQMSFIIFSSNSVHKGTMWSRSSDQMTITRSSR